MDPTHRLKDRAKLRSQDAPSAPQDDRHPHDHPRDWPLGSPQRDKALAARGQAKPDALAVGP